MENEEKNNAPETKKAEKPQTKKPVKDKNGDFKRKYFEFYDDIKISDRQDW
ncbi:MAG: hypothetical protein IJS67_02275 [Clostridia bacterium]|nr:hypothetical protein [Clostridia bacterium]